MLAGPARCIVEDPQSGPTSFDVAQIDAQGAVLRTPKTFEDCDYIDVALELGGSPRQALFAQVAGNDGHGLKLRWMHMDPSEETALQGLLDQWQAGDFDELQITENEGDALDIFGAETPKAKSEREGTRRITRPNLKPVDDSESATSKKHKTVKFEAEEKPARNKTVRFEATPMNNRVISDGNEEPKKKKGGTRRIVRPQTEAPSEAEAEGTKRKTRRVVKPTQKVEKPSSKAPASESDSLFDDESGAHNVVVTNTKRFNKLTDEKAAKKPKSKPSGTTSISKRQNVLSDDGKLDVGASIRNSAKEVSASELAERHDKLKVLNMSTIKALIQDAVAEAIEQLGGALEAKEKERLLKEAEDGFKDRLEAFKAEKKGMEAQASRLREQLDRAQGLLEEEKKRKIEKDQFTVSDTGIADLEKQFDRMLNKASKTGNMDNEFEDNLRKLVNNLLDDEREKIAEQARKAQDESIRLLERKVQRLAGTLSDTEKERDQARRHANELAKSGGGGGSVQNLYDVGLAEDDENKEAKLALLKDIFKQNQEMREHMEKSGQKIQGRKKAPKPKPAETPFPEDASDESSEGAESADSTEAPAESDAAVASADSEDLTDPDDMPWEPGKSYNIEDQLNDDDDEDDDSPVKKIVVADKEPPKLERKKKAKKPKPAAEPEATEAETAPAEDSNDISDPDDMPWEPAASDADDDDAPSSAVKKMSISADFEPPPLKRKK